MRNITRMSVLRRFRTRPYVSNRHSCLELDMGRPGTFLLTLRNAMWVVDKKDVGKVFVGDKFFEFRWEALVAWVRLIRNAKTRIVLYDFGVRAVRKSLFEVPAGCRNDTLLLFGCEVGHPHGSSVEMKIITLFAH